MPATAANLILQIQIPFAVLLDWLLMKERPDGRKMLGTAIAVIGVALVIGLPETPPGLLPSVMVMASAFFWAFGQVLVRRLGRDSGVGVLKGNAIGSVPQLALATLQRLKIVAPFDGVTGLKQVSVGDYLKDGADIVNIEDIDAVLVDFRLPERFQSKIRQGQQAQLSVDALPGKPFTALVQAVDPLIDANGRSVGIRGCIDNRQRLLRPGMFARVNTVFGVREQALTVPEEAIVPQGGKAFVIKVVPGDKPDTLVAQRVAVKTGVRQPGKVEITEGLELDDTVVTAGQQRLQKDGTPVRVIDLAAAGKGPNKDAAAAAPAGAASGAPSAPASAPAAPSSSPAKAATVQAEKPAPAKGAPAVPAALSGPNPCLRG